MRTAVPLRMTRVALATAAVARVASGQRVFVHGGVATPGALVEALVARAAELRDVELVHLHTSGSAAYAEARYAASFRVTNLFVGSNMRGHLDRGRVDYLPVFLSEIPALFRSMLPLDVAMVSVSPPDRHGYVSLGTSVDVARAAVDTAKVVIAQVNPRMPRVHGDGMVHLDRIDAWYEESRELPEHAPCAVSALHRALGRNVASLIEDGATLQVGIGDVPNAVLAELGGHRHLGLHTEMWSDGALPLLRAGVIDNSRKVVHPGRTISGFVVGTRALYDFVDDNPTVMQLDIAYVNDTAVIRRNPRVVAVNSAVEVDLTGQVCADSIGDVIISGVGGQMDFMRGAALSPGGKPIIALPSRTARGERRIVGRLRPGAGVVTTRAHVQFVVTEYGIADLRGKTLGQRARALIAIAHPEDRDALAREWAAT
ncbi:MAG: acetyl-CoA hydrolase/transferase C-terminal domain-containing protein [Kofleriaceae bacterium]|nr:acetyl-CoA hydrolase/transferase C-terminal domain-containing protein [Kofleriaceae bacterium]